MSIDPRIESLRAELTANDVKIVEAVNARLELVARLRSVKEELEVGFLDPGREQWLVEHLLEANGGPLSDDGLRRLVDELLALTKREVYERPSPGA